MAHFAEVTDDNVVLRVLVVNNEDCLDADGTESESVGASYCERLLGGRWLQTSYNGRIRKNYAGIGYTFDADRDAFIAPQPFPSWVLDEATCRWQAPVPYPGEGMWTWDEDTISWVTPA